MHRACGDEEPRTAGTYWAEAPVGTRSRRSWSQRSQSIIATAIPYPTALAALYPDVSNASSPMPTSSLQRNAAAAMTALAISAPAPNEMALADNHVAALLVTVNFAVASAVFVSAPVAGVAEEAVCAAAMSRARENARRAGEVMKRWAPRGMYNAEPYA